MKTNSIIVSSVLENPLKSNGQDEAGEGSVVFGKECSKSCEAANPRGLQASRDWP